MSWLKEQMRRWLGINDIHCLAIKADWQAELAYEYAEYARAEAAAISHRIGGTNNTTP